MNLENLCIMLTMFDDEYTVVDHGRTATALRHIDKGQDERDLVNRIAAKYGIGPIFALGEFSPMSGRVWDAVMDMLRREYDRQIGKF